MSRAAAVILHKGRAHITQKFVQFAILTNGVVCVIIYMSRGQGEVALGPT